MPSAGRSTWRTAVPGCDWRWARARLAVPLARLTQLQEQLQDLVNRPGALLECVSAKDRPDWLVQLTSGSEELFLVEGRIHRGLVRNGPPPITHGPFKGQEALEQLVDRANRIARASNLLGLADFFEEQSFTAQGPNVEVQLLRFHNDSVKVGEIIRLDYLASKAGNQGCINEGDLIAVQVANNSRAALDVSILAIDADDRISVFFPQGREINQVAPGASLTTPRQKTPGAAGQAQRLVVIAVPAGGRPTNYCFLASPTIAQARERAKAEGIAERTLGSPLGRLFQKALFAEGREPGIAVTEVQRTGLRTLFWRLASRKAPPPKIPGPGSTEKGGR